MLTGLCLGLHLDQHLFRRAESKGIPLESQCVPTGSHQWHGTISSTDDKNDPILSPCDHTLHDILVARLVYVLIMARWSVVRHMRSADLDAAGAILWVKLSSRAAVRFCQDGRYGSSKHCLPMIDVADDCYVGGQLLALDGFVGNVEITLSELPLLIGEFAERAGSGRRTMFEELLE